MKKLKPMTLVRIKESYTKWLSENADHIHAPFRKEGDKNAFGGKLDHNDVEQELISYFMNKMSYPKGLVMDGIVLEHNGYMSEDFGYLVFYGNELGFDMAWFEPEQLEVL